MVMLDAVSKGVPFGQRTARPDGRAARKPDILTPPAELSKIADRIARAPPENIERAEVPCQAAALALHPRARRHTIFLLSGMNAVRPRLVLPTIASMLVLSAGMADAATCYMLFDRYDNVVYRNTVSPIDLSEQGAAARAAIRQRGEYLMVMESDRCSPVTFVFGVAGSKTLSIDDVVGGFPAESPPPSQASPKTQRRPTAAPAPTGTDRPAPVISK
jgi:hypothetical protein